MVLRTHGLTTNSEARSSFKRSKSDRKSAGSSSSLSARPKGLLWTAMGSGVKSDSRSSFKRSCSDKKSAGSSSSSSPRPKGLLWTTTVVGAVRRGCRWRQPVLAGCDDGAQRLLLEATFHEKLELPEHRHATTSAPSNREGGIRACY